jgi:hypothetical protein
MASWIRKLSVILSLTFATIVGSADCSSVDSLFDCQAVCTKYKDCYNSSYDVGGCRDRCRTASANDATIRSKADQCDACISGMSCAGATFNCGSTCGAIVP